MQIRTSVAAEGAKRVVTRVTSKSAAERSGLTAVRSAACGPLTGALEGLAVMAGVIAFGLVWAALLGQ